MTVNWSLFGSVFALIFLAELGDKTQLALLSQSATSTSRWTVFVAASLALAASTAIGVLAGGLLRRWVPDERFIKFGAGVLFLLFGALLLREALAPRKVAAAPAPASLGALGRFVLARAASFEQAAFEDYRALAARATQPAVRHLLEQLAVEEESHFQTLAGLQEAHAESPVAASHPAPPAGVGRPATGDADREVLARALAHEEASAAFYAELAHAAGIPALRHALAALAASEQSHAARMRDLLS